MEGKKPAARIAITGYEGVRYETESLTFGVPFSKGVLPTSAAVGMMTSKGATIPIQTRCLATWEPEGHSVKWMLVDMQQDSPTRPDSKLRLEPMDSVPTENRTHSLSLDTDDGMIRIDTGVMRLCFRTSFKIWEQPHTADAFVECRIKTDDGWRDVLRGGLVLYMKDQYGNEYDSLSTTVAPKVVLEEEGPLRACVLVSGFLASKQGIRFCEYKLRIHLYAGKSDIRLFHTFIFNQDPHRVALSAVGIRLPAIVGDGRRAAVGGSRDQGAHAFTNWGTLSLVQDDDCQYTVTKDGGEVAEGERAPGWASLTGNAGSAVVAVRDFWQEYPKGFVVDESGIDIGVWPEAHRKNLVFSTPFEEPALRFAGAEKSSVCRDEAEIARLVAENPTAPLNLKSLNVRSLEEARWVEDVLERVAPGRTMTYNDTGTETGLGAAKTTEMFIRFSPDRINDADCEALAGVVNSPLTAIVDPKYLTATGAVEHFYHAGDDRFRQADADLDDYFEPIVVDPVEKCRLYGMMRFGNMVCTHSSAIGWVYLLYKDTDPRKALRYVGPYNNEANDQIMSVWGQFVRTGNPDYLRIAQRYSRAVADVGFVHSSAAAPERVGLMHYHNGHQWSGGLSPSHSVVSGILTDYYMTGNRRLLEVAREAGDRIVRTQEASGVLSCHNGTLHREYTGPLSILLDVYEATWEEKYGKLAERSLSWLLRIVRTPGRLPNGIFTAGPRGDEAVVTADFYPEVAWGNKYHLYAPALRQFRSAKLEEFLIAEADYWTWESPRDLLNYACTTVCFGYELTGKLEYAAFAKNLIDTSFHEFVESTRREEQMDFAATRFSGYIPRLMCIVADAMDKDADGFAAAIVQWKKKRSSLPDRPDEIRPDSGPRTSLGVLSVEPFPPK
jgi:hypothetical protein